MPVTNKQHTVYFGANLAPEGERKDLPDIYCPLCLGPEGKPNFWQASCDARKRAKQSTCYPTCTAPPPPAEIAEEKALKIARVHHLTSLGLTSRQIAEKIGISKTTVLDYRRKPKGEPHE